MSERSDQVRRPLHLMWDLPIVVAMAAANPEWGMLPCPLDGEPNQRHLWIRHEVSYDDRGEMDGLKVTTCNNAPEPKVPGPATQERTGRA